MPDRKVILYIAMSLDGVIATLAFNAGEQSHDPA